MTGGVANSQANGFFGAFLKFCGYDGLIVQGAAKEWVYLLGQINDALAAMQAGKEIQPVIDHRGR